MVKVEIINTKNLRIARENMGFDTLSVSKSIVGSKKDAVFLWESGKDLPTWKQLKKLAKKYNISELVLLSSKTIKKNKSITDFRVGIDEQEKEGVKKLINLVLKRQIWLQEIFKGEGYKKNSLLGSGRKIKDPVGLAEFITTKLDIKIEEIKNISGYKSRKEVLKYLIKKAEEQRIFVGKTISYHKISVSEMRGMFIANDYCPFIVLNRQDGESAQIFSFIHELAHLFRKSESVSNVDFRDSSKKVDPEEVFCNKVAANLLLPKTEFTENSYDYDDIVAISNAYKLSTIFVFYRLKDLNKIDKNVLKSLEKIIVEESKANVANKKKKKGGNFYNSMTDSNGALFNNVVVSAYFDKKINNLEAHKLLKFSPEKYV